MASKVGLRLALTAYYFASTIAPQICIGHVNEHYRLLNVFVSTLLLRAEYAKRQGRFLLRTTKRTLIKTFSRSRSPLLELPTEIRLQVYRWICTTEPDGRVTNANHILLLNRQIYHEAKPIFDQIQHTISIGDLERYTEGSVAYVGLPRITTIDEKVDWHLDSLKDLVLEIAVSGIGSMTPDCFDVYISHNGKEQYRNLKKLLGIWPHVREVPLRSVRLDLRESKRIGEKRYRADFIRIIRNFKRTKVWAETGDCSSRKGNKSMLLPLVKAFNQGRRNWVAESDMDSNLLVRFDKHVLKNRTVDADNDAEKAEAEFEEQKARWSILPIDDTSRSDNSVWPEWTGKEELYIQEKMIQRIRDENDRDVECSECLAMFDRVKEFREHISRGLSRQT